MELRVRIIGADSYGSRSMATVVEADSVKIFIDPSVSYAPRRYGLPPHYKEIERFCEIKAKIVEELADTDMIVITHYHYDHYFHRPQDLEYYRDKRIILKDPLTNINVSQRIRAYKFLSMLKRNNIIKESMVSYLDNSEVRIGDVIVRGSEPVPHGASDSKLGYVVMTYIECCEKSFLHASDVQGPIENKVLSVIIRYRPDITYISGPPTYLENVFGKEVVKKGLRNLSQLAAEAAKWGGIIIADHHMARDKIYPELIKVLYWNTHKKTIVSAADYSGKPLELLEAMRRDLWGFESEKPPKTLYETINCD